jgi:UDP-galactopyranose mutase
VPTVDHVHERRNRELQAFIRRVSPVPVAFCGRLANYQYINQDEAILQGLRAADELLGSR